MRALARFSTVATGPALAKAPVMSNRRTLRARAIVNHAYPRVRDVFVANPHYVFRHATAATAIGTAELHARVGGFDIGAEVTIRVASISHDDRDDFPVTTLALEWEAAHHPRLFPTMVAELRLFPFSTTETELELEGSYDVPMGKIGEAIDVAIAHVFAARAIARLLQDVSGWLREELAFPPREPASLEPVLDTDY
jgi:hypothetical protein